MKKYNFNLKKFCVTNIKKIIIAICSIAIILIALILISNYKQKGTESSTFSIKQIILYNNANVINSSNNPASYPFAAVACDNSMMSTVEFGLLANFV